MAKIIATNNGSIIKVGNSIGLSPNCCCGSPPPECSPCEYRVQIMSITGNTPIGNFTFNIIISPGNIWTDELEDGFIFNNAAIIANCDDAGSIFYAQLVMPGAAEQALGGDCGSIGLNGGIRLIPIDPVFGVGKCINATEALIAEGAVWAGFINFAPNEPRFCNCFFDGVTGEIPFAGQGGPWAGTTATFTVNSVNGC